VKLVALIGQRRAGWRLPVSLHHSAVAGLRAAHGGHRALFVVLAIVMYVTRKVDLVRTRRGLSVVNWLCIGEIRSGGDVELPVLGLIS